LVLGPLDENNFPIDDTPELDPDPNLDDSEDDIWDFGTTTKAEPDPST
jgi:hypothetical protein